MTTVRLPGTTRSTPRRRRIPIGVQRLLLVLVLIGVWAAVTGAHLVDPLTLPGPWPVVREFGKLITTGSTLHDLAVTMEQVLISLVISLVLGCLLGVLAWRYGRFHGAVYPWLAVANAVPGLLFYPVTIVLVGLGNGSIITLSSILATFTVSELMLAGLRDVPSVFLEVARSLEAGRMETMRKVVLPASFSVLASAVRVTFTIVFITVVAGQYILSGAGIGYALHFAYESFETNQVYAWVLLIMVTSLVCQLVLLLLLRQLSGGRQQSSQSTAFEEARI